MRDYDIESDLKQEKFQHLKLVQGDRGNKIKINVYEDGQPVNLTGCSITAKYKRADGQIINGSVTNISNNSFDAVIDSDITKVSGVLKMLFSIEKDDVKVSTFLLLADVREGLLENTGSSGGGEVTVDLKDYQKKTDNGLETKNKYIVGAINEVNSQCKDTAKKTIVENNKLFLAKADGTKIDTGTDLPVGGEVPDNVVVYEEIGDTYEETLIPIKSPNGTTYYLAVDDSGALTVQNTSGETVWEGGGASIEGVYFISNKLTNITNSNTAKNILEGDSYVATLTPSEGFEISDVVVKMGNIDITSTAYADGSININNVTGNIIITAIATKIPVKYTITNNLSKAINSNTATQVNENTSYVATISASEGYELNNVTVTIGGTDVTSSVYSNGKINITAVTGDIVITVTTTKVAITKTVNIPDIATASYTDKKAYLGTVTGYNTYKIEGVKKGDIITTCGVNADTGLFNDGTNDLTSLATKKDKDNYSWYQYTLTADKDYDVLYIATRVAKYAEGRATWTYTR